MCMLALAQVSSHDSKGKKKKKMVVTAMEPDFTTAAYIPIFAVLFACFFPDVWAPANRSTYIVCVTLVLCTVIIVTAWLGQGKCIGSSARVKQDDVNHFDSVLAKKERS
jgi:Fe2+ transport system protein B